jgi:hypothetical protein
MNIQDDSFSEPFKATVNGPVVVITGVNSVALSMKPEAVFASLEPLRIAAEEALRNRRMGVQPQDE